MSDHSRFKRATDIAVPADRPAKSLLEADLGFKAEDLSSSRDIRLASPDIAGPRFSMHRGSAHAHLPSEDLQQLEQGMGPTAGYVENAAGSCCWRSCSGQICFNDIVYEGEVPALSAVSMDDRLLADREGTNEKRDDGCVRQSGRCRGPYTLK